MQRARPKGNRYWKEVIIKINVPSTTTEGRCRYCGLVSSPVMEHRETRVRLCKVNCYFRPWVRKLVVKALLSSEMPSRTLVRVVAVVEGAYFYVVIPGWNWKTNVRVYFNSLPNKMRSLVDVGKRFHARVNIGAESIDELRFDSWEPE